MRVLDTNRFVALVRVKALATHVITLTGHYSEIYSAPNLNPAEKMDMLDEVWKLLDQSSKQLEDNILALVNK